MLKLMCTGRLGGDPQRKTSGSGETFVVFSVAVSKGKDKPAEWVEASCNGKTADVVEQYCRKGQQVLLEGTPAVNAYMKDGNAVGSLRLFCHSVEMLGSSNTNGAAAPAPNNNFAAAPTQAYAAPAPVANVGAPVAPTNMFAGQPQGATPPAFNAPGPTLQGDFMPF